MLHPLNRIVKKLEFGESFFDVMQNLCSLADVDFALTFDRDRQGVLYMTLENVSVMAAIHLSAQVAGRRIMFCRVDDEGDLVKNVGAQNRLLELFEIVQLDAAQRVKSRLEGSKTPLPDPLELFRRRLFQEAKQLKNTRFIVQVSPTAKKG